MRATINTLNRWWKNRAQARRRRNDSSDAFLRHLGAALNGARGSR